MFKRVALSIALAALVLPALASATSYDPSAGLGLFGRGGVNADLKASADARPVRIAVLGGTLQIGKVSDDVKVKCQVRGAGADAASCSGKAVLAIVSGSHFTIRATGKLFLLGIPKGYGGTVNADAAKQCAKEINCRRALQALKARSRAAANGDGTTNGRNAPANGRNAPTTGGGDITAAPGTDESIAQLQAALAALGKK